MLDDDGEEEDFRFHNEDDPRERLMVGKAAWGC